MTLPSACGRIPAGRRQRLTASKPATSRTPIEADVICVLVPDDVIPTLPLKPRPDALVIVASGYTLAFGRLDPPCDVGMVAPRMLGPEVRRCYLEGIGFITAVGVHRDVTGTARARGARHGQGHRWATPRRH